MFALLLGMLSVWKAGSGGPGADGWRMAHLAEPSFGSSGRDPEQAINASLLVLERAMRESGWGLDTTVMLLAVLPPSPVRAALGAMSLAGMPLRWIDSTGASGLALSVTQDATPRSGFNVRVSRPTGRTPLGMHDVGGLLDSLSAADSTGRVTGWRVAMLTPPVNVFSGHSVATVSEVAAGVHRRLQVIALPGWESKFTIAALEEMGWLVDAQLRISPFGSTTVGAPLLPDTARYFAVVVLDSMAVDASALSRFVVQGGGLLLSGDANRIPSLAALRPARATTRRGAIAGALLTATPLRGLDAWRLAPVPDAEVILGDTVAGSTGEITVVARRFGAGRVVSSAQRQLWHWRMEGSEEGASDHRRWWNNLVALVVPDHSVIAPDVFGRIHAVWPGDVAPYADMVALNGQPMTMLPEQAARTGTAHGFRRWLPVILFGLMVLSLFAEVASRRLRGQR